MQETSDGIVYPSGEDEYSLIADLAAMALSIQEALELRANSRFGTQMDRLGSGNLPDGTLWKDTTGDRALWVRDGGQWAQLWPDPVRRSLVVGSNNAVVGNPFLNLRRLMGNGIPVSLTLQQSASDPENTAGFLYGFYDGDETNYVRFFRDGRISTRDIPAGVTRFLPYGLFSTRLVFEDMGPDETRTISVNFPSGRFTSPPNIQLTLSTDAPQLYSVSAFGATTSSVQVMLRRNGPGTFSPGVYIHAMQPGGA